MHSSRLPPRCVVSMWSSCRLRERSQNAMGVRYPSEDAALRGDHLQPHGLKLRKVGTDAVLGNQAVVASVIRFAHGGVDADLGGHAGDDQLRDATPLEDGVQIGGEEGAL